MDVAGSLRVGHRHRPSVCGRTRPRASSRRLAVDRSGRRTTLAAPTPAESADPRRDPAEATRGARSWSKGHWSRQATELISTACSPASTTGSGWMSGSPAYRRDAPRTQGARAPVSARRRRPEAVRSARAHGRNADHRRPRLHRCRGHHDRHEAAARRHAHRPAESHKTVTRRHPLRHRADDRAPRELEDLQALPRTPRPVRNAPSTTSRRSPTSSTHSDDTPQPDSRSGLASRARP